MSGAITPALISKYFPVGAEVEVRQTDSGFQGSWYSGTVIEHTAVKSDSIPASIAVEYKTLKTNDDSARALRETVSPSQLRPIPPKGRQEKGFAFGDGDSVDAYLYEGWWEGVITGVLRGDSKYVVFVRGWRDEMEFEGSMLRVHRDWVKGRWVPHFEEVNGGGTVAGGDRGGGGVGEVATDPKPPSSLGVRTQQNDEEPPSSPEDIKQSNIKPPSSPEDIKQKNIKKPPLSPEESPQNTSKHAFSTGDLVEVSNDEEGLRGSWFTAAIVEVLTESKYLIEYLDLKDENGKDPLREEADIENLRPCPPEIAYVDRFEPFDHVEARYNDGWWEGIIRKVLKEDKYSVYFPASDELLKFRQRNLRVHHEWENGEWVIPQKQVLKL